MNGLGDLFVLVPSLLVIRTSVCCIYVFFFLVVFLAKGELFTRRDCVSSNASDPLILLVALIELGHYFPFRLSF